MEWDAVGSILKQTKRKRQLTIKTCIKYLDKKSPVMRPNLQLWHSNSITCMSEVTNTNYISLWFDGISHMDLWSWGAKNVLEYNLLQVILTKTSYNGFCLSSDI